MRDVSDYMVLVRETGATNLKISVSSVAEARRTLKEIRNYERQLRQIKKEINLDMKEIRAIYRDQKAQAGQVGGGILSLFGKRRVGGSYRAARKQEVQRERDAVLSGHENVKFTIDDLLTQLSSAKLGLQNFIEDSK